VDLENEVREGDASLKYVSGIAQRRQSAHELCEVVIEALHLSFRAIMAYSIFSPCKCTSIISIAASSKTDRHIKLNQW